MPYKVVPYVPDVQSRDAPRRVAEQLEALANTMERDGYEYVGLDRVEAAAAKGRLGRITGSPGESSHFYSAVFRKG